MKWAIGSVAFVSAACEFYGTYTVWKSYKLSSGAAQAICDVFEQAQAADDEYYALPENRFMFESPLQSDPQAMFQYKTMIQTGILSMASPLRPQRATELGLAAYVLGAVLGFVAVLLALV
jgi:hypothetical protein